MSMPSLDRPSRPFLLLLWASSLPLLLANAPWNPIQRTQEVRVLETGWSMAGSNNPRTWLVPVFNDAIRLKKPPLAYWLAAAAYRLFGWYDWVGRLPTVVMAWLTLAVTFVAGRWLWHARVGLLAAMTLLGSYLFCKHAALAETDVPTMLFVTAAIYAAWRGADAATHVGRIGWLHAAAAAMAGATIAKGAPAAFVVVFVLALAIAQRRARILLDWLTSGAILTYFLLAAPWFIYVLIYGDAADDFALELGKMAAGEDHGGWFFKYIPFVLVATLPWTPAMVLGLIEAFRRRKSDPHLLGMLLWIGAVLVPLMIVGRKQIHYMLVVLPPLFLLVGWWLDRLRWRPAAPLAAAGALLLPLGMATALPFVNEHPQPIARQLRQRFGDGPYLIYGKNEEPSVRFALHVIMPRVLTEPELRAALRKRPDLVVLAVRTETRTPPPVPPMLRHAFSVHHDEQRIEAYRLEGALP